jgi:hypothetical protein
MSTDRDLIINVIYMTGMVASAAGNIWLVYRGYRKCMKHIDGRASATVVRRDLANITFGAMLAAAWGVFVGMGIAAVDAEHRWIEATLLICMLVFIGALAVRPLRQLVQRQPDEPQAS